MAGRRSARAQFRLGTTGLFRGIYPFHQDIMDLGTSSQAGFSGMDAQHDMRTRSLTIREYEQTIKELKKENFDLKLEVYILEEGRKKSVQKDGFHPNCGSNLSNNVKVFVEQRTQEVEALRSELNSKVQLLHEATELANSRASENEILKEQLAELQSQLDKSNLEIQSFQEELAEKDDVIRKLEEDLAGKDDDIKMLNDKLSILCEFQESLVQKKEKAFLVIDNFVRKQQRDNERLPKEIRTIAETAVEAARSQKTKDLQMSLKSFKTALSLIVNSPSTSNAVTQMDPRSEMKKIIAECFREDAVYKSQAHISNQSLSQSSKEILTELSPKTSDLSLASYWQSPSLRGTPSNGRASFKDIVDFITISDVTGELSLSILNSPQKSQSESVIPSVTATDIEHIDAGDEAGMKELLTKTLEENDLLKRELEEKLTIVKDLKNDCEKLRSRLRDGASENVSSPISNRSRHTHDLSTDSMSQLREDNLLMTLMIEEKDKELEDLRQALRNAEAKRDRRETLDGQFSEEAMTERSELLERLAFSSQVNEELIRHLHDLEAFMEDLLQHKLVDSTLEESEQTSLLSHVSKFLNQSLRLSNVLSDHLSICEGSKLFEDCRASLHSISEDRSQIFNAPENSFTNSVASAQQQKGVEKEDYMQHWTKRRESSEALKSLQSPTFNRELEKFKEEIENLKEERTCNNAKLKNNEQKISVLEQEISQLQSALNFSETERKSLHTRTDRLQSEKELLSSKYQEVKLEFQKAKNEQSELQKQCDTYKEDMASMEDILDANNNELVSLKQTLEKLQSEKDLMNSQYRELEFKLEKAMNEQSDLQKVCDVYKEKIISLKDNLDENRKEHFSLQQTIENLLSAKKSLSDKCNELQSALEMTNNELLDAQKKCDVYKRDFIDKKQSLDANEKELVVLKKKIETLQIEKDSLTAVCNELEVSKSQTLNVQKQLDAFERDSVTKENLLKSGKSELECLNQSLQVLQSEKDILSAEFDKLKVELEKSKNQMSEAQKECQSYRRVSMEKREFLDAHKTETAALTKSLEILQSEKNSLSAKCSDLESTLENTKNQLLSAQSHLGIFETDSVTKHSLLEANKKELESLNQSLQDLQNEKDILSTECSKLKLELEKYKNQIFDAQKECDAHKKDSIERKAFLDENEAVNATLTKSLEVLQTEKNSLLAKCSDLESTLENTKNQLLNAQSQLGILEKESVTNHKSLETNEQELSFLNKRIQALQSANDSSECKELQEKIETLVNEKNSFAAKCNELEKAKNEFQKQSVNYKKALNENEKELECLYQRLEALQSEKTSLTAQCSKLELSLENAKSSIRKQDEEYKGAMDESFASRENENELETLYECIEVLESDKNVLSDKCNEFEKALETANNELEKQATAYKSAVNQNLNRQQSEKEIETLHQTIERLQSEKECLSDECVKLEKAVINFETKQSDLENKCKMYKEDATHKEDLLNASKEQIGSFHLKVERLQHENDFLSRKCHELESALGDLKSECNKLHSQFGNFKEAAEFAKDLSEKDILSVQKSLESVQCEKHSLTLKCDSLQSALEESKNQCSCLQVLCDSHEKEIADKIKSFNESLQENESLNLRIERLQHSEEGLLAKCKELQTKVGILQEQCDRYEKEVMHKKEDLDENKKEIESLHQRIEILQHSEETLTSKCKDLQSELQDNKRQLSNLQKQCNIRDNEVMDTKTSLDASQKDMVSLHERIEMLQKSENALACKCKELQSEVDALQKRCDSLDTDAKIRNELHETLYQQIKVLQRSEKTLTAECNELQLALHNAQNVITDSQLRHPEFYPNFNKDISRLESATEDFLEREAEDLRRQNDALKQEVEEKINQNIDLEKAMNYNSLEIKSLKQKAESYVNVIEKSESLVKTKNEEIIKLQERLFNLQTNASSTYEEDSTLKERTSEPLLRNKNDKLEGKTSIHLSAEITLETDENSIPRPTHGCCEKYWKKCCSLKKKLVVAQNQIKILEEQKASLRRFRNSTRNLEENDGTSNKVLALQQKVDQKKNFINELKEELCKACNSLIDREREVDNLKLQLDTVKEECRKQHSAFASTEENIKNVRNYKWTLLQKIFEIQQDFYKKKEIHSNHVEKLKHRVESLHSLLVGSSKPDFPSIMEHNKMDCITDLELDVECLENIKIFLTRYIVCAPELDAETTINQESDHTLPDAVKKPHKSVLESFFRKVKTKQDHYSNFVFNLSHHVDMLEDLFKLAEEFEESPIITDSKEVESMLTLMIEEIKNVKPKASNVININSALKNLQTFPGKTDLSDQESAMSEETISGCDTPPPLDSFKLTKSPGEHPVKQTNALIGYSWDSVHHRSQYSSPDLGIESDPNHEHHQKEESLLEDKFELRSSMKQHKGELYAICQLSHYELLKREVQECRVGIKSVLSRTGDGLHHIGKYTSPRKSLEHSTLRAIKDTCANIEVCLKEAYSMIGKFWVAHCPSEREWNELLQENKRLQKKLSQLEDSMQSQEVEFKNAMDKLEQAQLMNENMERKISKKLVKTKKNIRQMEVKLLENRSVPNYPSTNQ